MLTEEPGTNPKESDKTSSAIGFSNLPYIQDVDLRYNQITNSANAWNDYHEEAQSYKPRFFMVALLLGLTLVIFGSYIQLFQEITQVAPAQAAQGVPGEFLDAPASISFDKTSLNIPLVAGGLVDGNWILNKETALYFYLDISAPNSGLVIYGHNTPQLFGSLKEMPVGQTFVLKNGRGEINQYQIYSKELVRPTEVEKLITPSADDVVLFTCDGWFDSLRLIVKSQKVIGRNLREV